MHRMALHFAEHDGDSGDKTCGDGSGKMLCRAANVELPMKSWDTCGGRQGEAKPRLYLAESADADPTAPKASLGP